MSYREVTMVEVKEVLRLWLKGVPKKGIAVQRGLDPKTVRRQIKLALECGLDRQRGEAALTDALLMALAERLRPAVAHAKGDGWRRCEEHRAFIQRHLDQRVRLSKIRKLLQRRGVLVSYPSLHRFALSELGFGRQGVTVPVADCGPGEEVQLDTGWVGWIWPDLLGRRERFKAWIFTSALTRYRFVYPVRRETTASAIEACEAAWAFFGGVFKSVIVDNTKAIVDKADALHPRLIDGFVEYSQARGFVVDTTRVRHPKDKARVERAVQTVADDCFGGEELRSLGQAYEHARKWCEEDYGLRRHSTTQPPTRIFRGRGAVGVTASTDRRLRHSDVVGSQGRTRLSRPGGQGALLAAIHPSAPYPARSRRLPDGPLLRRRPEAHQSPRESAARAARHRLQRPAAREGHLRPARHGRAHRSSGRAR
jgi:hypothetical protein